MIKIKIIPICSIDEFKRISTHPGHRTSSQRSSFIEDVSGILWRGINSIIGLKCRKGRNSSSLVQFGERLSFPGRMITSIAIALAFSCATSVH